MSRWLTSCSTSPSAMVEEARDSTARMSSEPTSTISSKARVNRKSPTSTEALSPHTELADGLPRRSALDIDHVVVQQRGGMDELDAGRELDVAVVGRRHSRTAAPPRPSAAAACACRRRRPDGWRARGSAPPASACAPGSRDRPAPCRRRRATAAAPGSAPCACPRGKRPLPWRRIIRPVRGRCCDTMS